MTNKRLDEALTSIETALDELTKAIAHSQQTRADMAANAQSASQNEAGASHGNPPALSQEEMTKMRGELADAMDIVRQLQTLDSPSDTLSDKGADATHETS